jgi:hypothetical protein
MWACVGFVKMVHVCRPQELKGDGGEKKRQKETRNRVLVPTVQSGQTTTYKSSAGVRSRGKGSQGKQAQAITFLSFPPARITAREEWYPASTVMEREQESPYRHWE